MGNVDFTTAGLPCIKLFGGNTPFTTLFAATTLLRPITVPLRMMLLTHIYTLSSIMIS